MSHPYKPTSPSLYCHNSVAELAKTADISISYIHVISQNKDLWNIPYERLAQFSKRLGVAIDDILKLSGKEFLLLVDTIITKKKYKNRKHMIQGIKA